ncbi:MAG: hypothetical protein E7246_10095 [Lachnoclostridium sp.]|nr:hypothetical protein [Lachnoclostridium sp.]
MSKWMDNWLYERDKRSIEKQLDRCYRELMEICGEICNKYSDIPKPILQDYLNCECIEKPKSEYRSRSGRIIKNYVFPKKVLEIDQRTLKKYPELKEDIIIYITKKGDFSSYCYKLRRLKEWKEDEFEEDYIMHHLGF